jgi:hypothetical protein
LWSALLIAPLRAARSVSRRSHEARLRSEYKSSGGDHPPGSILWHTGLALSASCARKKPETKGKSLSAGLDKNVQICAFIVPGHRWPAGFQASHETVRASSVTAASLVVGILELRVGRCEGSTEL